MTDLRRRDEPLRVDPPPPTDEPSFGIAHVNPAHERTSEDRRAFADAVRALRTGGGSLNLNERTLMVLGGVIAPLGLLFVLLGWLGASRTSNLFEQIPYLISGGLFGLGLVFLGAFFYFAHWITELVKEHRTQSAALLEAITKLRDDVVQATTPTPVAPVVADDAAVVLVATTRGSMAHRPECAVVAGKGDLRHVAPGDALAPCKLCDPYEDDPSVN